MTYSELLYYLKGLAENTPLVNTVTRGEISGLDLDKANIYPLVHIDIAQGVFNEAVTMSYDVYIACLQQRDMNDEPVADKFWRQDNEVDNHNETLLMLQTIWTNIYRDWQDKYLSSNDTPTFEKISYAKGNILDGWSLQFVVEVPFSVDLCQDETSPVITVTDIE